MDSKQMLDKLRFCDNCNSEHIALVDWEEVPHSPEFPDCWLVTRYCGECESHITDIYSQSEVDLWDEWLDDEADQMLKAAKRFERENMEEWVEGFLRMLELDAIYPEDF